MEEKKNLSVNLRPEVATGKYSNLAMITHSRNEFIIDFAAMLPGIPQADVVSRIIMTPEHAKRLMFALIDNVKKFEAVFGDININDNQAAGIPINGNGPKS